MPRKTTIASSEAVKVENNRNRLNNKSVRKPKLLTSTKISKRKANRKLLNAIGPSIVKVRCQIPGKENTNTVKKLLPYSEETILECLNAIMNKEMTQKYASEHYNIPKSTIYKRLKALKNRDEKGDKNHISINTAESPDKQNRRLEQKNIRQAQQTKEMKITLKRSDQEHMEKKLNKNIRQKKNKNIHNNKEGFKIEENKLIASEVRNKKEIKPKLAAGTKSGINKIREFQTKKTKEMNSKSIDSCLLLASQKDNTEIKRKKQFKIKVKNWDCTVDKDSQQSNVTTESKNSDSVDADIYHLPKVAKDLNENIEHLVLTKKRSNRTKHPETLKIKSYRERCKRASRKCNISMVNTKSDINQSAKVHFVQPVKKQSIKVACENQDLPNTLKCKENIQPISVTIMQHSEINSSVSPKPITTDNNGTDPPTPGMSWINDISSTTECSLTPSEKIVAIDGKVPFVGLTDCVASKEHGGDFFSSIRLKPISRSLESTSTSSISDQQTYRDVAFEDMNTKQAALSSSTSSSTSSSSSSTSSSNESDQPIPAEIEPCFQEEMKRKQRIKNIERLQNILANFNISSWMEQLEKATVNLVNETHKINDHVLNSFVSDIPLLCDYKHLITTNKHNNRSKKAIEDKTNLTTSTSHTGINKQSHIFSKPKNMQLKRKSISLNRASPSIAILTPSKQQHTTLKKDFTNNNLVNSNKDAEDEAADDDDDALSLYADSIMLSESFSSFRDTKRDSEKSNTPSTTSGHSNQTQTMDHINRIDFTHRLTRGSNNKSPISFEVNVCDKVNVDFTDTREEVANCFKQNESFSSELNDSNCEIPCNVNTQVHDYAYYDRYVLSLTQHTDKGKLFLGVCFHYQTGKCWAGRRCIYPHNILTPSDILSRMSSYDNSRVIHEYICLKKNYELYLRFSNVFYNIFEERKCLAGIELLAYDSYSLYPNPHMVCRCLRLLSENEFWQPSALLCTIVHDARAAPPPMPHQAHQPNTPHVSSVRTFADVLLEMAVQDMTREQRDHYSILFKLSAYLKNINRKLETNSVVTLLELVTSQKVKNSNILQKVYHDIVLNSDIVSGQSSNQCLKKFCEMLSDPNLESCHNAFNKSVQSNKNSVVTPLMGIVPRFEPPVFTQNAIPTKNIFSQYHSDYTNRSQTHTSRVNFNQKVWIDPWEKTNCSFQNQQPNTSSLNFNAAVSRQDAQRHTMLPHQNTNLFQKLICQPSLVSGAGINNELSLLPQDSRNQSELNVARIPFQPYPRMFGPSDRGTRHNKKIASRKLTKVDCRNVRRFGVDFQKRKLNNDFRQPSDFQKTKTRYDP